MPRQSQPVKDRDPVHSFLIHAGKILSEVQFIIDSIPNVEPFSVERGLRQLHAIHYVLTTMEDEWLAQSEIDNLIETVLTAGLALEQFQNAPAPPRNVGTVRDISTSGRPRYIIDLDRAIELHDMGNGWDAVADALGVCRRTLYYHLERAGISPARPVFTNIDDDTLDEKVAEISLKHPFAGGSIVLGHLEAEDIHLPIARVQESLRRVDAIGVIVRWNGIMKRRVYRVRGANAVWHFDANEKLTPWDFYVHGCIDGYSRLLIYLACCNNKRSKMVEDLFLAAVQIFGWPSRTRCDFEKENNGVERQMIAKRGVLHRASLRGRSTQNIRMERNWRDVRKDTLQVFREIFMHLEEVGLLDMNSPIDRVCLYIVFQPRIQASLDETHTSWNLHRMRTEKHKSPCAIYELSRERAINRGYWTGDPRDDLATASHPSYGEDSNAPLPPLDELANDPEAPDYTEFADATAEREAGVFVNDNDEVAEMKAALGDFDYLADDGNWGIDVYCHAVALATAYFSLSDEE
ncbi:Integrase catalytic domain-containing protein [Mycena venus]|uniref:Integrase catalytic domain-containing protein n=1 Tax=Mycena venus TaxID=2733690 RepID=A0A8H6Y9R9_9AGAR|nr:Integrase catalytic domain-containing protein [Mycena venus]